MSTPVCNSSVSVGYLPLTFQIHLTKVCGLLTLIMIVYLLSLQGLGEHIGCHEKGKKAEQLCLFNAESPLSVGG